MSGLLEQKVAIVTGGGSGIGRGICLAFATEGARLVVADIDPERARASVAEIRGRGADAMDVVCDVREQGQVRQCVETAAQKFGGIDILVNNAVAPPMMEPLLDTTPDMFDGMWQSGPLGSVWFMQECYPYLRARGGNIVNVSSRAGMDGAAGYSAYGAAKEAIRTLTKVAAREWGPEGIRVNSICPAAATPAHAQWAKRFPDLAAERAAQRPLGRNGDCELDIGCAVVMLASDYARYVTGNNLLVDGGTCSW
jgi:NAD(P)-dependent dehydrogenase (short-subunit alcohol dehydrogenase family)